MQPQHASLVDSFTDTWGRTSIKHQLWCNVMFLQSVWSHWAGFLFSVDSAVAGSMDHAFLPSSSRRVVIMDLNVSMKIVK